MGTIKQKKAAEEIAKSMKGKESKTAGEILEKVGYSEAIAKNPKMVLESEGFLEEFEKLIPNSKLTLKHNQLLEDEKSEIQIKALDMAYKVKGNYAPEKSISANLNLDVEVKQSQESKDLVDEYEEKVKNMLKEKK